MHLNPAADPRVRTRLVGLDVLRLIAVVLVLGRHIPLPRDLSLIPWPQFFAAWFRGGWIGVDLFFVLSGFLVSGLLFAEYRTRGAISPWRFYVRRGWKIYPPFYVLIAVTLWVFARDGVVVPPRPIVAEVFFLQSYLPGIWNHTWSLAVEEHFYFLLPLILVALLKCNKTSATPLRPILAVAALVAVGCLALRWATWSARPVYDHARNLFPTHLRLDGLFFGVALSYVYYFHTSAVVARLRPWRQLLMLAGVGLLAPAFVLPLETTPWIFIYGFTPFYVAAGMLLIGTLVCEPPRRGPLAVLLGAAGKLGSYSYSIYLWHMPMLAWGVPWVRQALGRPLGFLGAVGAYVVGSLVVGVVMAKLVELPSLKLRERFCPAKA